MVRNSKRRRRAGLSAADEELLVRALHARAVRDAGGVPSLAVKARNQAAEQLVRAAVNASAWGRLSATTIAIVTIDAKGQVPADAALIVHGVTVALPLQGLLGGCSALAANRIGIALDRLGYQFTGDGLSTVLRSTDTLAFPVTRKQPVKLRIVSGNTAADAT